MKAFFRRIAEIALANLSQERVCESPRSGSTRCLRRPRGRRCFCADLCILRQRKETHARGRSLLRVSGNGATPRPWGVRVPRASNLSSHKNVIIVNAQVFWLWPHRLHYSHAVLARRRVTSLPLSDVPPASLWRDACQLCHALLASERARPQFAVSLHHQTDRG